VKIRQLFSQHSAEFSKIGKSNKIEKSCNNNCYAQNNIFQHTTLSERGALREAARLDCFLLSFSL
jgi:hypothetical protein